MKQRSKITFLETYSRLLLKQQGQFGEVGQSIVFSLERLRVRIHVWLRYLLQCVACIYSLFKFTFMICRPLKTTRKEARKTHSIFKHKWKTSLETRWSLWSSGLERSVFTREVDGSSPWLVEIFLTMWTLYILSF